MKVYQGSKQSKSKSSTLKYLTFIGIAVLLLSIVLVIAYKLRSSSNKNTKVSEPATPLQDKIKSTLDLIISIINHTKLGDSTDKEATF